MTEAEFQTRVLDYAKLRGWRVVHIRPAMIRSGRWVTPYEGHPGLPDLVLARAGEVILAELKSDTGKVSKDQGLWLAAAGTRGRVWRPANWDLVVKDLN